MVDTSSFTAIDNIKTIAGMENTNLPTQEMLLWSLEIPQYIGDKAYDFINRIANSLDYYDTPHPSTTSDKKTKAYTKFMKNLRAFIGYITHDSGMATTTEIDLVVSNTRRFFKGKRITCWVSFSNNYPPLLMHWSSKIGFQPIV